jgi:hypothetical protein
VLLLLNTALDGVTVLAVRIDCISRSREQPRLLIVIQRKKDVWSTSFLWLVKATAGYPVYNSFWVARGTGSSWLPPPSTPRIQFDRLGIQPEEFLTYTHNSGYGSSDIPAYGNGGSGDLEIHGSSGNANGATSFRRGKGDLR